VSVSRRNDTAVSSRRVIVETDEVGQLRSVPTLPPNSRVEVIVLDDETHDEVRGDESYDQELKNLIAGVAEGLSEEDLRVP